MKKITTYLFLTLLFSSGGYYILIHHNNLNINPFLAKFYLMWCPGLSGIITSLIYEKNLTSLGLKLNKLRWLGIGYSLPIFYASFAYAIIWLLGFGRINPGYQFNTVRLIGLGTLFNIAFASGEEIGWRGFLVPQLYKLTSFTKTCLITGLIWSAWHFPLIISGIYLASMPTAPQLLLLVITVTAMTFPISWLRLKSKSVWPAILLHASHNLYIQRLFDPLTAKTGPLSKYMIGESGIIMAVVLISLAIISWSLRKSLPNYTQEKLLLC